MNRFIILLIKDNSKRQHSLDIQDSLNAWTDKHTQMS